MKSELRERGANDRVDFNQISEDADTLEDCGQAKVVDENGFVQVESKGADGLTNREAQLTINEDEGLDRFFSEDGKHGYKSEVSGGRDDLSLAIYTKSGRTVELDLQEIQSYEEYLKHKEEEERKLPKAA